MKHIDLHKSITRLEYELDQMEMFFDRIKGTDKPTAEDKLVDGNPSLVAVLNQAPSAVEGFADRLAKMRMSVDEALFGSEESKP